MAPSRPPTALCSPTTRHDSGWSSTSRTSPSTRTTRGSCWGAWGASQELAGVLDTEPGLLHPKLDGDRRWNVVATGLTSEVRDEIKELEIPGLTFEEYAIRSYPSGAVGGNLVGFVGSDGQPLAGLEYSYDDILAGEDGKQQYERGLLGEGRIPLGDTSHTPAVDGTGIRLTIDPTIQHYAQEAAAQAAEEHEAEWASVVMMDVQTGKILAASEAPSVDPNAPGSVDAEDRRLAHLQQPGSSPDRPRR